MRCSMKKPAPKRLKPQPLAVGELWFVRLPQATQLACVLIDAMTEKTIVLILEPDSGQNYDGRIGRYERSEIKFVERIP